MARSDLTLMRAGQRGRVLRIRGGFGMRRRLEALGIRQGVEILKVSAQIMHGPVIAQVGNTQIAMGFGMARHIIVEVKDL